METKQRDKVWRDVESLLNKRIDEIGLLVRVTNNLMSDGIVTVCDLVSRSDEELLEIRSFGETTLKEVKPWLKAHGLRLRLPK